MTFKRPTRAGWAVLAIAALCVAGFVDVALAQTTRRLPQPRAALPFPTRAIPPGCWYPAHSF